MAHHHQEKRSRPFEAYDRGDNSSNPKRNACYNMITANCGGDPVSLKRAARIRRLKPHCQLHENISNYVNNSRGTFPVVNIRNIYKINRRGDPHNFTNKYRMMLWHGTASQNIPNIIQSGFKLGVGGDFGAGVYFADRITVSLNFTRNPPGSGSISYILLGEVHLGKAYKAHHLKREYTAPPPHFRTVKAMGEQIPDWNGNTDYYGAIMPCGTTKTNPRHPSYDFPHNEYVIYDTNRVIIRVLARVQLLMGNTTIVEEIVPKGQNDFKKLK